jgi:pyruvate-formate lyase
MEDEFTRAKRYLELAAQMRSVAKLEPDIKRKNELLDLARQYDRLAEKPSSGQ